MNLDVRYVVNKVFLMKEVFVNFKNLYVIFNIGGMYFYSLYIKILMEG